MFGLNVFNVLTELIPYYGVVTALWILNSCHELTNSITETVRGG